MFWKYLYGQKMSDFSILNPCKKFGGFFLFIFSTKNRGHVTEEIWEFFSLLSISINLKWYFYKKICKECNGCIIKWCMQMNLHLMVMIVMQYVVDKMSLLCCTRDDTLKVLDLRMNQISTTLAWVNNNHSQSVISDSLMKIN